MSICTKDFTFLVRNIKRHKKESNKFLFDFTDKGERYRQIVTIDLPKHWGLRIVKEEATKVFLEMKKEIINNGIEKKSGIALAELTKNSTLHKLVVEHLKSLPDSGWTKTKFSFYERYLKEPLGGKKAIDIQEHHIMTVIRDLQKKGMKTRTVNTALEVLKPAFDFGIRNNVLAKNPAQFITLKKDNVKKHVMNASEAFKKVFDGINEYYKDDAFYRALFLFGFTGRRKNEILTLTWENVDLDLSFYWIEDTKNDERQKFELPAYIKECLLLIPSNRTGLVFASPVTGGKIKNIDRQVAKFRDYIKMSEFTLHYMRNILVSALSERGVPATTLSGILGHRDINTINKYLSQNYHNASKQGLAVGMDIIDAQIVEGE